MKPIPLIYLALCLALGCGSTSPPPAATTEPSAVPEAAPKATTPPTAPDPTGADRPPDDPRYHAYVGYPKSMRADSGCKVLINTGYTACYSESRKVPLWVAYRVFAVEGEPKARPRPSRFKVDDRTEAKVSHDAYTNSGYDRGHMAPYYAIDTRYGEEAGRETFLMSNIVPQEPALNRGLWRAHEQGETEFAVGIEEVWIITGPYFDDEIEVIESGVEIPDGFYRIWLVAPPDGSTLSSVMIFEHDDPYPTREGDLAELEELTGLDFPGELEGSPPPPWSPPTLRKPPLILAVEDGGTP